MGFDFANSISSIKPTNLIVALIKNIFGRSKSLFLHQDLADAFIARHKHMVTLRPPTVRAMVHLFQQLGGHRAEAEAYYMAGVDLVVPSVYPEQEGIAAGSEVVRIEARVWMTAEEMAVLARIALLEIGNVGIISKSEQRTFHLRVNLDRARKC